MRSKISLLVLCGALAGCGHKPYDQPSRGLAAVNVPVISRTDYVFDAAAPGGMLPPSESARLDAWFRGLGLSYGDAIYVDGADAYAARSDVVRLAGNYGLMVNDGAPVTAGSIVPGMVRVVVSRKRAEVPNCPNWSVPAQPNYQNKTMANFGCGVNANLAAMVANPEDLIRGRADSATTDSFTADKAIDLYRKSEPTGSKGLQDVNTKKKDQ